MLLLHLVHELRMHIGARMALRGQLGWQRLLHIGLQQLPQLGLPQLLGRHGHGLALVLQDKPALRPIGQPIGAVTLVAIKHIGHLLRQLITLTAQGIMLHIGQQRFNVMRLRKLGQQTPKAPDQSLLVKGHGHGHHCSTQDQSVHAPDEARRQLCVGGRTNAHGTVVGQGHL